MERTTNNVTETVGKSRFKKLGGGTLRFQGKIIKPGQIFTAFPNEIPALFRKFVLSLDGDVNWKEKESKKEQPAPPPIPGKKPEFILKPRGKSTSLFDIVTQIGKDDQGEPIFKVMNEKALKKEAAEKLIESLSK